MQTEILMIGTELLLGQIQDTNATYLGQTLAAHGINLFQKATVGDNRERIMAALEAGLRRSDVILCSGGLGPTEDDITRECIAELLGRRMVFREALYERILERFAHVKALITENNKKQATLPEGAEAIENPNGTAPGLIVEDPRGTIICMPGVPHELKAMFKDAVIPYLRGRFGLAGVLHYRVLKVCGVGESRVDSMIGDLITSHANPSIGLLASPEAVRIRIAAHAPDTAAADALIDPVEEAIRARLGHLILGRNDDTIESVVDGLLRDRQWRMAVVETATGGMLCQRLVAAGASSFAGGQILPFLPDSGAGSNREAALDLSTRYLLESKVECVLVLMADPVKRATTVVFRTVESVDEWEVPKIGAGTHGQLRTSVWALERVRRHLLGIPRGG